MLEIVKYKLYKYIIKSNNQSQNITTIIFLIQKLEYMTIKFDKPTLLSADHVII